MFANIAKNNKMNFEEDNLVLEKGMIKKNAPKNHRENLNASFIFLFIHLKGPKHDQIECGFFYINQTSMGR